MKVIFLDFDGVLNSVKYRESVVDYYDSFIDETRMPLLKQIVEQTGAGIVLTTAWRHYWSVCRNENNPTARKIDAVFEKYGMRIYSKTENLGEQRDLEISLFLCNEDVESYVILDDLDFGWKEENRRHFVKTDDTCLGLDSKTVCKAIEILNTEL